MSYFDTELKRLKSGIDGMTIDQYAAQERDSASKYYCEGKDYYSNKKLDGAVSSFDRAIDSVAIYYCAKNPELRDLLPYDIIMRQIGSDKSINCSDLCSMKGRTLNDLEKYEESIKWHDCAIKEYPENYFAHFNKGFALCMLKKSKDAITHLDLALGGNFKFHTYIYKAYAYHNLNDWPSALKSCETAMRHASQHPLALRLHKDLLDPSAALKNIDYVLDRKYYGYTAW